MQGEFQIENVHYQQGHCSWDLTIYFHGSANASLRKLTTCYIVSACIDILHTFVHCIAYLSSVYAVQHTEVCSISVQAYTVGNCYPLVQFCWRWGEYLKIMFPKLWIFPEDESRGGYSQLSGHFFKIFTDNFNNYLFCYTSDSPIIAQNHK